VGWDQNEKDLCVQSNDRFTSSPADFCFFYQYTLLRWTNTINLVVLDVYYLVANINYYSSTLREPRGYSRYGNTIHLPPQFRKTSYRVTYCKASERPARSCQPDGHDPGSGTNATRICSFPQRRFPHYRGRESENTPTSHPPPPAIPALSRQGRTVDTMA